MLTTPNYGLRKPEGGDPVDVRDLCDNFDIIDKELKSRPMSTGNASQMTVEFEDAKQLTELTSNDTLRNLFSKLKLAVRNVIKHGKQLGDTDIAGIGDGTVTGAIYAQNSTVSQCLKSVSDGKSAVASAITAQGVTTAADADFQTMADNISLVGSKRYDEGVAAGNKMIAGSFTVSKAITSDGVHILTRRQSISFGSIFGTSVPHFGIYVRSSSGIRLSESNMVCEIESVTATGAIVTPWGSKLDDCIIDWVAAL